MNPTTFPLDPAAAIAAATYAAVILTAGLASAVNSIAGGGTFLTFPALTGLARLSEKAANMTSTVGLWPGSAASVFVAKSEFRRIPSRLLVTLSLVSLAGGIIGSSLLIFTSNHTFRMVIPWLLAFATLIFAFAKTIGRWAGHKHGDQSLKWKIFAAGVQFMVAIYGGYFGAGIGVLMLAGLSFSGLEDIHQINALKVLLATIINGVTTIIFLCASVVATSPADRIHWPLAAGMICAAITGGFLGMHFARRVKQNQLRACILLIGITLTIIYFYRDYAVV